MNENATPTPSDKSKKLSPKWQSRFDFFERYGNPRSPKFRQSLSALPTSQRIKFNANIYAFFFGAIYFFILGLWRKALVLLGIGIGLTAISLLIPEPAANLLGLITCWALPLVAALTANHAYYLHCMKGSTSWNLFEGWRRS